MPGVIYLGSSHDRLVIIGHQVGGINVQGLGSSVTATSGSTAMKYLVQQMLMSPGWTMTPDEWAEDEMTARAAIQAGMAALLLELTAIPAPANS